MTDAPVAATLEQIYAMAAINANDFALIELDGVPVLYNTGRGKPTGHTRAAFLQYGEVVRLEEVATASGEVAYEETGYTIVAAPPEVEIGWTFDDENFHAPTIEETP